MLKEIRKEFPVYKKNPNLVFLDTAASSLKPIQMINSINDCYSFEYSNVHRGIYSLSSKLTKKFEDVRKKVSKFISSKSDENIIFTKSATEGINLVVEKFSQKYLSPGDEVIISYLEHHANIVPWHIASKKYKFKIIPIKLNNNLELDLEDFKNKINSKTKFISLTHMSNVTGSLTNFNDIKEIIKNSDIPIMIDGCQFVAHSNLNVLNLDCDFYVFSGHKLYGPSGIGILYMKDEWFEKFDPYQGGGSMIDKVEINETIFAKGFQKFEAGTPPIAEVIGLGSSIDFVNLLNLDKIYNHEKEIHNYALDKLNSLNEISIYGNNLNNTPIISFNILGIHPNDLALILDQKNIAIRTGHHCAQPLMKYLNIDSCARASFGVYNNKKDVDIFVESLIEAKEFLS
tara:strand:+ start:2399 stop:3601 length:1203 start_codon:yes stop_codon:yes gene_type:complete